MPEQEVVVDVREVPPREKHPLIFRTWESLPVGSILRLVNDHDPKPLSYQFLAEKPGEYSWTYVESGPERWIVNIKRVAQAAARAAQEQDPEAPEWAKRAANREFDARKDLQNGVEPLPKILAEVGTMTPGMTLLLHAGFEPAPLYKLLALKGFEHWSKRVADDHWTVYFHKKPKACK